MTARSVQMCTCGMLVLCLAALTGCGGATGSGLPETVTVELPDGTTVEVDQGAGVPSLANTIWELFQTTGAGQSLPFVTISFGPEGELERFENNTIASEIFGDTIIFDGSRHNTTQKGLTYAAATFGAETSDSSGFTFEGRLSAFAGPIQAADATATAVATYDPDDPDTVVGTFSFSSRVTVSSVPEGDIDLEFGIIGHRVTD